MIPKSHHLDALPSEKLVSFFIAHPLVGKAVSTAIQFDSKICLRTAKIQKINTAGVLATKLELVEPPVTQQTPEPFFGISGFSAQLPGKITGLGNASTLLAVLRYSPA